MNRAANRLQTDTPKTRGERVRPPPVLVTLASLVGNTASAPVPKDGSFYTSEKSPAWRHPLRDVSSDQRVTVGSKMGCLTMPAQG